MQKKIRCVFDRGLLPWDKDSFRSLFLALATQYDVQVEELSEGHRKILTTPVDGLDNYRELMRLLVEEKAALKVYMNVAEG